MTKKPASETITSEIAPQCASTKAIEQKHLPGGRQATQDVVLIHGRTEDQKGLKVLRARNNGFELGEVRPLAEGKPITSDVVRLRPRKDAPYLCDVETEFSYSPASEPQATGARTGPAQVASNSYRSGWDTIWAKKGADKPNHELN